ncbi:MAG: imelysin family protein, partial [Pseudomonadota bacterium]
MSRHHYRTGGHGVGFSRLRALLLIVLLGGALSACVNDGGGDDPAPEAPAVNPVVTLEAALERSTDNAIIPAVQTFLASVEAMDSAAESFCAAPDRASLSVLQGRWRTAFENWYRLSLYNFGPLDDDFIFPAYTFIDSLRLRGTDYLETVRSEIMADLD